MTPMMQQYKQIKKEYPDSILFFRLGDFYEMFFDDAKLAAKELEIALTARAGGGEGDKIPMCGVPHHASEAYIAKLVQKGYKVAICEQLEDPKQAKGIVKRDVIQIITPGTLLEEQTDGENRYLISILNTQSSFALAGIDVTTGELSVTAYDGAQDVMNPLYDEIAKWQPKEVLVNQSLYINEELHRELEFRYGAMLTLYTPDGDIASYLTEKIPLLSKDHPLFAYPLAQEALFALIHYVYRFSNETLAHIREVQWYEIEQWLGLDQNTRLHLDLQKNQFTFDQKHTLFSVLHHTNTAMGTRMLHQFIERPLQSKRRIEERLDMVEVLVDDPAFRGRVGSILDGIYDLDRLLAKLSYQKANGRDLLSLAFSLHQAEQMKQFLYGSEYDKCHEYALKMGDTKDLSEEITRAIVEDPPILITEGGMIREGYNLELDTRRETSMRGQDALILYEQEERERTGIKNLKIVFHKNKGYFIDVTKSNVSKVPDEYHKIQTLTNSDRYRSRRLEEIEHMIFDSQDETKEMEYAIFQELRQMVLEQVELLQQLSSLIAQFDVYYSFAHVASLYDYVRPIFHEKEDIMISEGRHPVVEMSMEKELFVHNDTNLGAPYNRIQIITGPNMAGKSTYMRQVALICLMAQMGSFVPAKAATLPILDRIFTRIGASDYLPAGDSTFMVEMKEMSYILSHASEKSLLVLDEIGRGTSTYDGMSIAWAIIEYIAANIRAKTLFATHYHELTALAEQDHSIQNMTVLVQENQKEVVFLRKLVPGQTDKSYGIEVAKMANFPDAIIRRAQEVLNTLEEEKSKHFEIQPVAEQLELFHPNALNPAAQVIDKLREIDVNQLTPLEAMNTLAQLQKEIEETL